MAQGRHAEEIGTEEEWKPGELNASLLKDYGEKVLVS